MPATSEFDFLGEGTNAGVKGTYDPNDEPNPANPGGVSNNELRRRQSTPLGQQPGLVPAKPATPTQPYETWTPEQIAAYKAANGGQAPGTQTYDAKGYRYTGQDATDYQATHKRASQDFIDSTGGRALMGVLTAGQSETGRALSARLGGGTLGEFATDPVSALGHTASKQGAGHVPRSAGGGVASTDASGINTNGTNPTQLQSSGPGAGIDPATGLPVGQAPATGAPAAPGTPGAATPQIQADYSRYDQAAQDLDNARNVFTKELDRLAGVDPFGNQAQLQKATDRAVAQASGTAAMARGGSAALAGANRVAQGTQQQLTARGIQDMAQQRTTDANNAASLRLTAASGISDVAKNRAGNEVALGDQAVRVGSANLDAKMKQYGIDAQIGQAERESLRQLGVAMAQIDMDRYKTDTTYRMNVDNNVIAKYVSDNQLKGVLKEIQARENVSSGEALMGILGAASGIAGVFVGSDERIKHSVRDPDVRDLEDYLGKTKGKFYHYHEPGKAGRRPGLNFGPMAQALQQSKIGATLVVDTPDGLKVDTARLALADHSALASLAADVKRLKARLAKKSGGSK